MKSFFSGAVIVFTLAFCSSFYMPGKQVEKIVRAKLKQKRILFFSCGILKTATVFRFEVTNEQRKLKKETIYVTIKCPEGLGDGFFSKGKIYELHLSDDTSGFKEFLIFDQFDSKGHTQWVAKTISKL